MLLTIYNLPSTTRYVDIKALIRSKCGLKEVILDNLTSDNNNSKRVTVGLAEEEDAAILVRKINGMFFDGRQLFVETIKKKPTPGSVMDQPNEPLQPTLQQPFYQQSNYQPNYQLGFSDMSRSQSTGQSSMSVGAMFGTDLNAYANYGYPQQMQYQSAQMMAQPMGNFDQGAPLGFSDQSSNTGLWSVKNEWNSAGNDSVGNRDSQRRKINSRWDSSGDNSSHSRSDVPARDNERDRASRSFGRDPPSRDFGRNEQGRNIGRNETPREFGRRSPPRDFGRNAPPNDFGRDTSSRDFGRDPPSRDRGRDPPRQRGRDVPVRDRRRDRESPPRHASAREHTQEAPMRRNEPRYPTKRQLSPKPSNSYTKPFSQTSKLTQQRNGSNGGQAQNNTPSQPRNVEAQSNLYPPVKRSRRGVGFDGQKAPPQNIPGQAKMPAPQRRPPSKAILEKQAARAITWRNQAVSSIAKEIIYKPNHSHDIRPDLFLQEVKALVRVRLLELVGENNNTPLPNMIKIYRRKYSLDKDTEVFNQVKEEFKKREACKDTEDSTDAKNNEEKPAAAPAAARTKPSPAKPAAQPAPRPTSAPGTNKNIPSYPQGDKRMNKEQKKKSNQIFENEQMVLQELSPEMQKALHEEIDEIGKLMLEDLKENSQPEYKGFEERIRAEVIDDCKKMLKVNFAKRIANIGPIMLRIFIAPKIISRGKLAPLLAKYGITSLRKSVAKKPPLYYGTCESYDIHDKLCAMGPVKVDVSTVEFKPFQLAGNSKQNTKAHRGLTMSTGDHQASDDENDEEYKHDDNYQNEEEIIDDNQNEEENGEDDDESKEQEINQEFDEVTETCEPMTIDTNDETENGEPVNTELQENNQNGCMTAESIITEGKTQEMQDDKVIEDNNLMVQPENNQMNEIPPTENLDFTADVDLKTDQNSTFRIDAEEEHELETKDLAEINSDELEDFRDPKKYDDLDIADVNEDDLEDW